MKKLKKYTYVLGLAIAALTTVACEDQSEEITSIEYSRYFAPINLEARVLNLTDVRLTWTPSQGATSYNIEVFANDSLTFEGQPVVSLTGITANQLPYTIENLEGDTKTSVRVQAVGEDASKTSTWSSVYVKTEPEQLFMEVSDDDIESTEVTLRWPAGINVTHITISPQTESGDYQLSAEEIANGVATVTGLAPETDYTFRLKNGEKTCGTQNVTSGLNLEGKTVVEAGADLVSLLDNSTEGEIFVLPQSEFNIGDYELDNSITLISYKPSRQATINGRIKLGEGVKDLTLSSVIMDGSTSDGGQAFDFVDAVTYGTLTIEDSEIRNYEKGFYYVNKASTIESINIDNCLIHDIVCSGGDMFDCRAGYIKTINLTNSTVWSSCAERDFIRYDDKSGDFPGATPTILVDHCTIDGVSNNSSRRLFYIRFKGNKVTFTNNIVSNTEPGRGFTDSSNTDPETVFNNNNYFNTKNLISNDGLAEGKDLLFDAEGYTFDPGYVNAAEGDFTLSHEDLIYYQVGDPRWY